MSDHLPVPVRNLPEPSRGSDRSGGLVPQGMPQLFVTLWSVAELEGVYQIDSDYRDGFLAMVGSDVTSTTVTPRDLIERVVCLGRREVVESNYETTFVHGFFAQALGHTPQEAILTAMQAAMQAAEDRLEW